jgi:hypothetical protein
MLSICSIEPFDVSILCWLTWLSIDKFNTLHLAPFLRDPTEGIFGYWWKSLREGIKSVFTVKKTISRNHKKNVKAIGRK